MPECELLKDCAFFNDKLDNMPGPTHLFKQLYCLSDNSICARLMVAKALGRPAIPPDLFPNHEARAKAVIIAGQRKANDQSSH